MTETTKEIFEKHEVRKTKKQKTAFIEYIKSVSEEMGYRCEIEKGSFGVRNIVIGNPDTAKVFYTAHYDTAPVMPLPNFITPKSITIYILFNIALALVLLIPCFVIAFLLGTLINFIPNPDIATIVMGFMPLTVWLCIFVPLLCGPANKHTANDNTSGVTALLDIMASLPEELRSKVCFVFFDLEEVGMFGSSEFRSKHKDATKDKLVLNFDCISDGKTIIFAVRKKAVHHIPLLEQSFIPNGVFEVEIASKGVIYPSDQMMFPQGVGVAALKKSKSGILYMDRIHTKRDTVYEEDNISFIVDGAVKLADII